MRTIFFSTIFFFFFFNLNSQTPTIEKNYSSLYITYGQSNWLNVSYDYAMYGIQYDRHYSIHSHWELIIQPNINSYKFHRKNESQNAVQGIEVGINFNILWKIFKRNNQTKLYLQAGTGPHFLDKDLYRQVGGWMFSNNFYLGYAFLFNNKMSPEIRLGFRHISNAETKLPNGGINSISLGLGIRW